MKKKWLFIVMVLLLLIALLQFDGRELLDSISQIPWWLLLLLLGLQMVTQLLINLQWYKIAKITGISISFWDMFEVNCQGAVIDSITPGVKIGGEVTRAIQISRMTHCSGEHSAAIVALQKLFSMSALFVILLFSIGYLVGEVPWFSVRYVQILIYSLLLLFLLLYCGIFFFSNKIKAHFHRKKNSRSSWIDRIKHFLFILLEHVDSIRKNKRAWFSLTILSLLIWVLYPIKMYVLVLQFHSEVHLIHLSAITFAAYLVAMLPIFPGGLGGFEGTMSGLLLNMGFLVSDAAVITIFFRFVTFWFVMLFSCIFIVFRKIIKNRTLRP